MSESKPSILAKLRIDFGSLFLILLSGILPLSTSLWKSNVWDEPYYILDGYLYLTHHLFWPEIGTSIIASISAAFPLLFLSLKLPLGFQDWIQAEAFRNAQIEKIFFFQNTHPAEMIFLTARLPISCFSVLLAYFIYRWCIQYHNRNTARIALLLYCFCPLITSYAGIVVSDLPLTCLGFILIYSLRQYDLHPSWKNAILTGILLGLTLSVKSTGFLFIPILIFYFAILSYRCFAKQSLANPHKYLSVVWKGIVILFIGLIIANLWFLPTYDPWGYFHSLDYIRTHLSSGHNAFFMGQNSPHGWRLYYPAAFLIKTPIALLILILLSVIFFPWKKFKEEWRNHIPSHFLLWIPVIILFGSAIASTVNIGMRHILPIYPFLFILCADTFNRLWYQSSKIIFRTTLAGLLVWYIGAWLWIYPYDLAYFNEFIGGPKNGYKYLVDSNLDWGQDLKNLERWVKKNHVDKIYLHYFGLVDYNHYQINRLPWPEKKEDLQGYVAVSVTDLQAVYLPHREIFDWLKTQKPVTHIGYSILIYHFPEKS